MTILTFILIARMCKPKAWEVFSFKDWMPSCELGFLPSAPLGPTSNLDLSNRPATDLSPTCRPKGLPMPWTEHGLAGALWKGWPHMPGRRLQSWISPGWQWPWPRLWAVPRDKWRRGSCPSHFPGWKRKQISVHRDVGKTEAVQPWQVCKHEARLGQS